MDVAIPLAPAASRIRRARPQCLRGRIPADIPVVEPVSDALPRQHPDTAEKRRKQRVFDDVLTGLFARQPREGAYHAHEPPPAPGMVEMVAPYPSYQLFTVLPIFEIRLTHTIEMKAASSAYSIRSWPCSSRSARIKSRFMIPILLERALGCRAVPVRPASIGVERALRPAARNLGNLGIDVVVDAVDAAADVLDRRYGDQRDEPGEKRVLDQVLTLLFADEALEQILHDCAPVV